MGASHTTRLRSNPHRLAHSWNGVDWLAPGAPEATKLAAIGARIVRAVNAALPLLDEPSRGAKRWMNPRPKSASRAEAIPCAFFAACVSVAKPFLAFSSIGIFFGRRVVCGLNWLMSECATTP